MDSFTSCNEKHCRKYEILKNKKRTQKQKFYKCSRKERLTRINQYKVQFNIMPLRNPIPRTLCEKKRLAFDSKNIRENNELYVKPWQKCLRKYKCTMKQKYTRK
jgi:hypothetical protein